MSIGGQRTGASRLYDGCVKRAVPYGDGSERSPHLKVEVGGLGRVDVERRHVVGSVQRDCFGRRQVQELGTAAQAPELPHHTITALTQQVQGLGMASMEAGPTLYPVRDLSRGERAREAPKSFALPTCQDPHFFAPQYNTRGYHCL